MKKKDFKLILQQCTFTIGQWKIQMSQYSQTSEYIHKILANKMDRQRFQ